MPNVVKRLPEWRENLHAYLVASHTHKLVPGKYDCALDAATAVKAMTGKDFARGFRGYRTFAEGIRKLRAKGFRDHVALASSIFVPIPWSQAKVGDLAIIPTPEGDALGVVIGDKISVFGPGGRGTVPLHTAISALRVGL
jgi:hypothetical protein